MLESTPSMYTEEANDAVRAAVIKIETMAQFDLTIRNKETLTKAASPILREVGATYGEIWDTEPRSWIADKLDTICAMHGWSYNEWEPYDW